MNAYDLRTQYGNNLHNISKSSNTEISKLTPLIVKEKMKYRQVDNEDKWRIDLINDLLLVREGLLVIPNIDREEAENMLNFACSS